MKKMKVIDKTTCQYGKGGKEKTFPVWPTIRKRKVEEPATESKTKIVWTFTFDWGQALFWAAVILIIYSLC